MFSKQPLRALGAPLPIRGVVRESRPSRTSSIRERREQAVLESIQNAFRSSASLMTFFSIFAAGMIFTLFSLLFGGHEHGDLHGEPGHEGADQADGHGPGMFSL